MATPRHSSLHSQNIPSLLTQPPIPSTSSSTTPLPKPAHFCLHHMRYPIMEKLTDTCSIKCAPQSRPRIGIATGTLFPTAADLHAATQHPNPSFLRATHNPSSALTNSGAAGPYCNLELVKHSMAAQNLARWLTPQYITSPYSAIPRVSPAHLTAARQQRCVHSWGTKYCNVAAHTQWHAYGNAQASYPCFKKCSVLTYPLLPASILPLPTAACTSDLPPACCFRPGHIPS